MAYNIPKTVIIYGAGASIPFYRPPIDTRALTCEILRKERWRSLIGRYTNVMDAGVDEVSWEPVQCCILQALKVLETDDSEELNRFKESFSFEELIELVDKYCSYSICGGVQSIINPQRQFKLLKFFNVNMPLNHDQTAWVIVPFLFRQLIAEIMEEWNRKYQAPNYRNLLTQQVGFLSEQLQQGKLSVYTLNYDDILPQTILEGEIELETGFRPCRFDSAAFLQAKSVFAFLHGHARWTQDDDGIRLFTSISKANNWRLNHLGDNSFELGDNSFERTSVCINGPWFYDFNTFLTTGQDKESSFNQNPYCAYYQRLAHDLIEADGVVIVGYSFRDPHINRLLSNLRSLRPKNGVLVIDCWPDEVDLVKELTDFSGPIKGLLDAFKINSISVCPRTLGYKFSKQLTETNKNGYGFLCPYIWIYKRGYEKFLSEWQPVLDKWKLPK